MSMKLLIGEEEKAAKSLFNFVNDLFGDEGKV